MNQCTKGYGYDTFRITVLKKVNFNDTFAGSVTHILMVMNSTK